MMLSGKATMAALPVYLILKLGRQIKKMLQKKRSKGGMPMLKPVTDAITTRGKRIVEEIQLFLKVRLVLIVTFFASAFCYAHFASDARLIDN